MERIFPPDSALSEEWICKRDNGSIPPFSGSPRFTPPGNAGRGFCEVSEVLPFPDISENRASENRIFLEYQQVIWGSKPQEGGKCKKIQTRKERGGSVIFATASLNHLITRIRRR